MEDTEKLIRNLFEIADELYAREVSSNCVYPESWSQYRYKELIEKAQKIVTKLKRRCND